MWIKPYTKEMKTNHYSVFMQKKKRKKVRKFDTIREVFII